MHTLHLNRAFAAAARLEYHIAVKRKRAQHSAIVRVVGVLSVLTYFFFSLEHKGAVGKTARVGVWFLMITFGSAFGLTVMGRITLLAQRFEFLFTDWLNIG